MPPGPWTCVCLACRSPARPPGAVLACLCCSVSAPGPSDALPHTGRPGPLLPSGKETPESGGFSVPPLLHPTSGASVSGLGAQGVCCLDWRVGLGQTVLCSGFFLPAWRWGQKCMSIEALLQIQRQQGNSEASDSPVWMKRKKTGNSLALSLSWPGFNPWSGNLRSQKLILNTKWHNPPLPQK